MQTEVVSARHRQRLIRCRVPAANLGADAAARILATMVMRKDQYCEEGQEKSTVTTS